MKNNLVKSHPVYAPVLVLSSLLLLLFSSCKRDLSPNNTTEASSLAGKQPKTLKDFTQVNLVGSDNEYNPARIDPLLLNAWGIAWSPTGTAWISAEASGTSAVYNKEGIQVLPAVTIPTSTSSTGGHPTGQVFNSGPGFRLPNGNPARFIFAGADGVISAWNGGPAAIKMIDDPGEAYLGIAIANSGTEKYLYVANFSENEIEVYDTAWQEVSMSFMDPNMPAGYAPFNIQNIDNKLFVMYAKVGAGEEEPGPGNGYVDVFNPDGNFVKRFVSRGQLNAPWGIAKAPASFWGDDGTPNIYLVGNFGDGRINAFTENGEFIGQLRASGQPIVIEGLWGISFAPVTATSVDPNRLYFAAGPEDEEQGLFGYIRK